MKVWTDFTKPIIPLGEGDHLDLSALGGRILYLAVSNGCKATGYEDSGLMGEEHTYDDARPNMPRPDQTLASLECCCGDNCLGMP